MREEFERAYWKTGIPDNMFGSKDMFFAKDEFGKYKLPHVAGAWWAWKTSKEFYKE